MFSNYTDTFDPNIRYSCQPEVPDVAELELVLDVNYVGANKPTAFHSDVASNIYIMPCLAAY